MGTPRAGDQMALMEPVVEGIRVQKVTVQDVQFIQGDRNEDLCLVSADGALYVTNLDGVGSELVPIDQDLAQEFVTRGDRFIETQPTMELPPFEQELPHIELGGMGNDLSR